jgi:hypothetical protein
MVGYYVSKKRSKSTTNEVGGGGEAREARKLALGPSPLYTPGCTATVLDKNLLVTSLAGLWLLTKSIVYETYFLNKVPAQFIM